LVPHLFIRIVLTGGGRERKKQGKKGREVGDPLPERNIGSEGGKAKRGGKRSLNVKVTKVS